MLPSSDCRRHAATEVQHVVRDPGTATPEIACCAALKLLRRCPKIAAALPPLLAQGTRFAVLHGEGTRPSVSIYNMRDSKTGSARGVVHVHTMANKQCSDLRWSPNGRFLVLAGLKVRAALLILFVGVVR